MALTIGRGPFGREAAGTFDFTPPERVTYLEPLGRRVRAVRDGRIVIDSDEVRLVHESDALPRYLFPPGDVDGSVEAEPHDRLDGHVTVAWHAVDAWFEEDERVLVHPRDPYHRVDTFSTSRRVAVRIGGETVAASTRTRALYETGLPARYYFPRSDVRVDLLERSDTVTECPYKGTATHWSLVAGGRTVPDVAWSYEDEVRREGEPVRGLVAFYDHRVDLSVD